jgi:flavorubredoxin
VKGGATDETYAASDGITVLPYHEPAGPLGFLPIHAYLLKGDEPILVETGLYTQTEGFLEALWAEIEPQELRWVMVTHEDLDHAGNLEHVLAAAPNAVVVLSFLSMLKYSRPDLLTPDRLRIAMPGEPLTLGRRRFQVIQPPVFDSAGSVGYFDETTGTLFSGDSFGGLVPVPTSDVDAIGPAYMEGSGIFMSANSSWLHDTDPAKFGRRVDVVRALAPEMVLPTHGAPLRGRTAALCDHLESLPAREPFRFPNDAGFRDMLAEMKAQDRTAA